MIFHVNTNQEGSFDDLEELFKENKTFDQWLKDYPYTTERKRLFIAKKMLESAKTSSNWRSLFNRSALIQNKRCFILEKIVDSAESPDDIFFAIRNSPENYELQLKAEDKIVSLCKTFKECIVSLRMCTDMRSSLSQKILNKAEKFDVSFEELCKIRRYHGSRGNIGIVQAISAKFAEISTTIENWIKIYQNPNMPEDIKNIAIKRILCSPV